MSENPEIADNVAGGFDGRAYDSSVGSGQEGTGPALAVEADSMRDFDKDLDAEERQLLVEVGNSCSVPPIIMMDLMQGQPVVPDVLAEDNHSIQQSNDDLTRKHAQDLAIAELRVKIDKKLRELEAAEKSLAHNKEMVEAMRSLVQQDRVRIARLDNQILQKDKILERLRKKSEENRIAKLQSNNATFNPTKRQLNTLITLGQKCLDNGLLDDEEAKSLEGWKIMKKTNALKQPLPAFQESHLLFANTVRVGEKVGKVSQQDSKDQVSGKNEVLDYGQIGTVAEDHAEPKVVGKEDSFSKSDEMSMEPIDIETVDDEMPVRERQMIASNKAAANDPGSVLSKVVQPAKTKKGRGKKSGSKINLAKPVPEIAKEIEVMEKRPEECPKVGDEVESSSKYDEVAKIANLEPNDSEIVKSKNATPNPTKRQLNILITLGQKCLDNGLLDEEEAKSLEEWKMMKKTNALKQPLPAFLGSCVVANTVRVVEKHDKKVGKVSQQDSEDRVSGKNDVLENGQMGTAAAEDAEPKVVDKEDSFSKSDEISMEPIDIQTAALSSDDEVLSLKVRRSSTEAAADDSVSIKSQIKSAKTRKRKGGKSSKKPKVPVVPDDVDEQRKGSLENEADSGVKSAKILKKKEESNKNDDEDTKGVAPSGGKDTVDKQTETDEMKESKDPSAEKQTETSKKTESQSKKKTINTKAQKKSVKFSANVVVIQNVQESFKADLSTAAQAEAEETVEAFKMPPSKQREKLSPLQKALKRLDLPYNQVSETDAEDVGPIENPRPTEGEKTGSNTMVPNIGISSLRRSTWKKSVETPHETTGKMNAKETVEEPQLLEVNFLEGAGDCSAEKGAAVESKGPLAICD